jgi:hypothetical protein
MSMRLVDWLFVLGVIALILGPLLTLRLIARQDARRKTPPRAAPRKNDDWDEDD